MLFLVLALPKLNFGTKKQYESPLPLNKKIASVIIGIYISSLGILYQLSIWQK